MNSAFVFIKPHAVTDAVKEMVKAGLEAKGCKVLTEGSLTSEVIDEKKLIDQHYYAIASKVCCECLFIYRTAAPHHDPPPSMTAHSRIAT